MKTDISSDSRTPVSELSVPDSNRQAKERSERLRQAAKEAGGNIAVARRSGVPLGTLNKYLAGGEMKLTAATALAQACGVSLEWLASGTGQHTPAPAAPVRNPTPASEPPADSRLFNTLNIDKFAEALEAVLEQLGGPRFRRPTHQVVQAAVLIYDLMQEPDEADEVSVSKRQHNRQDHD